MSESKRTLMKPEDYHMSLEEVGAALGLSSARIGQIERQALDKLRRRIEIGRFSAPAAPDREFTGEYAMSDIYDYKG